MTTILAFGAGVAFGVHFCARIAPAWQRALAWLKSAVL
jgi:hypothetical protein